jgi:hypothetical protein
VSAEKKQALRWVKRSSDKAKVAAANRDDMIRDALEFCSLREVGEAAGLSPARIHQIRHGR